MEICTRFPPEPSGRLHAGHIKSIMYNYSFAKQKEGKFILRFDDSNPETCTQEYVNFIQDDIKLMNIIPDDTYYMSDYFDITEKYITDLINVGNAYVETDDGLQITQNRKDRIESKSRNSSIEINLKLWDDMKNYKNKYVVRLKIDMSNNNGSLRDPIVYRVCNVPHYRIKTTHNVIPLFDFISPIVDALQGVTHIMRTTEFTDKIPLHKWILEKLNMKIPTYKTFSRMNLSHTVLSKRKLRAIIDNTELNWEHPMIPTIRGLYNRGYKMDAFLQYFAKNMSFKTTNVIDDWDRILKLNRTLIDKSCHKLFATNTNIVSLLLTDACEASVGDVYINMMNKDMGTRKTHYPTNNVIIDSKDHNELKDGKLVLLLMYNAYKYHKKNGMLELISKDEIDLRSTYKMSWLTEDNYITVTIMICNQLLSKPSVDDGDNIIDVLSDPLYEMREIYVENYIKNIKQGETIQLYRMGYFIVLNVDPFLLVLIDEPGNARQFLL
jgi:glutamyl/glutaminyl-tRNA synthetase